MRIRGLFKLNAVGTRFLVALVCVSSSSAANARIGSIAATPVTEPTSVGPRDAYIDWSSRELYAWGEGHAPREVPLLVEALPFAEQAALEAARAAMRQLVSDSSLLPKRIAKQLQREVASDVPNPARGTLRNFLSRLLRGASDETPSQQDAVDAQILAKIASALESGHAARTSYGDDGSVQLQLRLPLDGGRGGLGEAWMQSRPSALLHQHKISQKTHAGTLPNVRPPTGIVVQARGLGMAPALWPRLVRGEAGCHLETALYSHEQLSDEMLRSYGVAPFVRSIEAALRAPRVADRAMLVRAGGRCSHAPATLWLEEADADAIEVEQELLREGRVVLVVD